MMFKHILYVNKIKLYKTIILTVVLYGCETWSLTLSEERRLRVFENRRERSLGIGKLKCRKQYYCQLCYMVVKHGLLH